MWVKSDEINSIIYYMMKIQLPILLLMCLGVQSQTNIALENCPDDFNVTNANVSTGIGTSQIAQFFFAPFRGDAEVATVEDIIIKSDKNAYEAYISSTLIWPYIAIACLFFVIFMILICCTVFQKTCPPCHSWRRDFVKNPYEKVQIYCVTFFAIFCAVGILATSIAAFVFIPSMQIQIKYTKCAIYTTLNVALNGDQNQWGGYSHIKNQVGNISQLLSNASTKITTYFNENDTLSTHLQELMNQNIDIYYKNKDSQIITPNPTTTQAAIGAGQPLPLINSYFIQNTLGPNGTAGTMVDEIYNAILLTKQLSDQADQVLNSASILAGSASTIQSNTANSQTILTMYQNQLNGLKANMDVFKTQYFDVITGWGIYVVEVVVGLVLVASLVLVMGAFSVTILQITDCRYFIHFGWVVYGIAYFGVIAVSFAMFSLGSMGYTFCQYYSGFLTNQTQFQRIGQYYYQNVLTRLDTCIYGDGDVLKKFQVSSEMTTVANLFTHITTFNDYEDATSPNYINQQLSKQKILDWNTTINEYRLGIRKDVDAAITSDDNPLVAISKMNEYTNEYAGAPFPHCSKDKWVYDVADCTNPSEYIYQTPVTQAQGTTINLNYVTCISLNLKLYQSSPSNWTERDIGKRYVQIRQDCPVAFDGVVNYAESITNYRDSRQNLFQSINTQLTDLHTAHLTFELELDQFRSSLSGFSSEEVITSLNNLVTNKNSGLLVSSDCRPVGDQMRFLYNSFCLNFMGMVVQLGLCMLILLAVMVVGMLGGCLMGQRIATMKRLHKLHETFYAVDESIHSQNMEKRQNSEDSNSSQSD